MEVPATLTFVPYIPGHDSYGTIVANSVQALDGVKQLVLDAVDKIPYHPKPGAPYVIAEYGTCDGVCSKTTMVELIDRIQTVHGKTTEINLIYEDQACNDFGSLFRMLDGSETSPQNGREGVFAFACGRSYHSQCFPSNTLHLGFAVNATHFLSKVPVALKNSILFVHADKIELEKFRQQGLEDWNNFLLQRAKELAPGGMLIMVNLASTINDADGSQVPKYHNTAIGLLTEIWKAMWKEELITQEEWINTTLPYYFLTLKEFTSPFDDPHSPVILAGLRLKYSKRHSTPSDSLDPSQVTANARQMTLTLRGWCNYVFQQALSPARSQGGREPLVDELFRRFETGLIRDGYRDLGCINHVHIVIQKVVA